MGHEANRMENMRTFGRGTAVIFVTTVILRQAADKGNQSKQTHGNASHNEAARIYVENPLIPDNCDTKSKVDWTISLMTIDQTD